MGSVSTMANKCFFKILNIYLFLAVLDLHSSHGLSLINESRAYSLALVHGLLVVVASLVAEHEL